MIYIFYWNFEKILGFENVVEIYDIIYVLNVPFHHTRRHGQHTQRHNLLIDIMLLPITFAKN